MADALTAPFLVAALVLCTAAVAKLRSPAVAVRALAGARLPSRAGVVRGFAAAELAVGAWSLAAPSRVGAATVALAYAGFAGLSLVLARRAASCGCFGDTDAPASVAQSLISAILALVSFGAAVWPAHGLGWVLGRPASVALSLAIGILGAAYATVLVYTELPAAWSAWSAR